MKKFMYLILVIAVVISLAGISVAAESERAVRDDVILDKDAEEAAKSDGFVGEDIETADGEAKIVSAPVDYDDGESSDAVPPTPEELLMEEQKRVDAANEAEAGNGDEPKDISMPVEDGDTPVSDSDGDLLDDPERNAVVGEDIEIADGEAKIVSVPDVVGDDIDLGDDEAKIVSVEEEEEPFNWPLAAGIAGAVVVVGGIAFLLIKKFT